MAVSSKRVVDDMPRGGIAHEVRIQLNALLDEISAAADFDALKTAVDAGLKKIVTQLDPPQPPQFPTL